MAAEQNEKAYQKQLGVNVGCVFQPRLNPRASPARASPCFFPSHRERQALTPSRLSSLPTASAPRARRRVPARTVPATTRTSVLASRPRVRLSRVSRPHRDREARFGVALDFQGSLGLEAAPRFLGSRRAARGPARGRTWTRFVCESPHTPRLDRPRPSRPVRRAIAPRRARRWGPCQPPHPAPRGQPKMMIFRHATPPLMPHERNTHMSSLPPSPRQAPTSTRSAPSPETCPSAAAS